MEMFVWDACHEINQQIQANQLPKARNQLYQLLDRHKKDGIPYTPLLNQLIRQLGLYPYLDHASADWQEQYVSDIFKVDTGDAEPKTLHLQQSKVLKRLLNGDDLVLSAPTSFGKSFIIDAFISIKKPKNVVIIVPTIALMDETRRRLCQKFSKQYNLITTANISLQDQNIFIFPQERVFHYVDQFKANKIDLLVVDEFYKASLDHDKERAPLLMAAILKLSQIAKQRYFLAPNITSIEDNDCTQGMAFERLDFNTVFLDIHHYYDLKAKPALESKEESLTKVLNEHKGKALIYAGTFKEITNLTNFFTNTLRCQSSEQPKDIKTPPSCQDFAEWLRFRYGKNWELPNLIERGVGIHHGRLHRFLGQLQASLFEREDGLQYIISTSSIIEGVNTSAQHVILWKGKNGGGNLDYFSYQNLIGRSGRMFKHFVGHVHLLEQPPQAKDNSLVLDVPEEMMVDVDFKGQVVKEKQAKQSNYHIEVNKYVNNPEVVKELMEDIEFKFYGQNEIIKIAKSLHEEPEKWTKLKQLNYEDPSYWAEPLFDCLKFKKRWPFNLSTMVVFIQTLSFNWQKSIPELMDGYRNRKEGYPKAEEIGINDFFQLEKAVTFELSKLLNVINKLQLKILEDSVDISPFIEKVSHAFLPPIVYQLEEYGLPRMLCRRIFIVSRSINVKLLDLEDPDLKLNEVLERIVRYIPQYGVLRISSELCYRFLPSDDYLSYKEHRSIYRIEKWIYDRFCTGIKSK